MITNEADSTFVFKEWKKERETDIQRERDYTFCIQNDFAPFTIWSSTEIKTFLIECLSDAFYSRLEDSLEIAMHHWSSCFVKTTLNSRSQWIFKPFFNGRMSHLDQTSVVYGLFLFDVQ